MRMHSTAQHMPLLANAIQTSVTSCCFIGMVQWNKLVLSKEATLGLSYTVLEGNSGKTHPSHTLSQTPNHHNRFTALFPGPAG